MELPSVNRPLNLLWIYCDELRTDALGCYGHASVEMETPHLDRLAGEGVLFRNCFTNSPLCVPARTSTLTGLHPEQTGVYANEGYWAGFRLGRTLKTFPEMLADAGYATADFGKIHIPREMKPFQYRNSAGEDAGWITDPIRARGGRLITPRHVGTVFGGAFPGDLPYPPAQITRNATDWLRGQDGPFCLRISYLQPHTPVCPPPPYDTWYAGQPFRRAFTEATGPELERRFAEVTGTDGLTPEEIYLTQQHYYGLVRWIDDQVGEILDTLEDAGLSENTLVVFHSDHGASLGEGGCYAKHTFAPHVHRVPLLIRLPGTLAAADRDDLCQSLDLAPTLLAACGLAKPEEMSGRDLLRDSAPDAVFGSIGYGLPGCRAYPNAQRGDWADGRGWPRRSCIRTDRYRLDLNVLQDGGVPEEGDRDVFLADWRRDPEETRNLAELPEYREIRRDLEARVLAHAARGILPAQVQVVR